MNGRPIKCCECGITVTDEDYEKLEAQLKSTKLNNEQCRENIKKLQKQIAEMEQAQQAGGEK